ncbi:MAG: phosphotransferase [Gammaproteobacteria bacterium]|nr:phosphotransferase [Gammaproteobacteria bacterium]
MPGRFSVALPVVSRERIEETLAARWGLRGTFVPLNGERDLNFRVLVRGQPEGRSRVFKICNASEDASMLECQEQVLARMAALDGLEFPRVVPTVDGESRATIRTDDGGLHLCRLTSWVDGRLFSGVNPRRATLHRSLGQCIARVDQALQDFRHPALERRMPWDLCRAVEVLEAYRLPDTDPGREDLIAGFTTLYRDRVLTVSDTLRRGAIHNDANDNNILIGLPAGTNERVCGLIDFGDILYGWLVSDVAIACAYAMLDNDNPLDIAADIVAGYHEQHPLLPEEVGVVFPLACIRLCLSVCIAFHHQIVEPENSYLGIGTMSSWRMLEILSEVPPDYPTQLFRDRCGLRI